MCPARAEESPASKPINEAFESTLTTFKAKPGNEAVIVEWAYTNHWDIPLLVDTIDTSCGCLGPTTQAATPEAPKPIAPGKSGIIQAKFVAGAYRGVLRKSIHVRFAGYDKNIELVAEAHIPAPIQLSSQELTWDSSNEFATQTIEVTTGTEEDFQVTDLLGVHERLYTIKQETVTDKRHYRLHITPTDKSSPGIQTLQVRTNARDPRDRVLAVFLRSPAS